MNFKKLIIAGMLAVLLTGCQHFKGQFHNDFDRDLEKRTIRRLKDLVQKPKHYQDDRRDYFAEQLHSLGVKVHLG